MSHYRNLGGGRRDANEPEIMQRFRHHGWHPEQVSGNRQWDLNVYPPQPTIRGTTGTSLTLVCHVDVKGLKGKVEEAQREKWKALSEKGIPVYVVRTEADVDALVRGELEPWRPESKADRVAARLRAMGMGVTVVMRDGKPARTAQRIASAQREYEASPHYTPPRSPPVDAAKGAAETFAPGEAQPECAIHDCREHPAYGSEFCAEHTP